MFLLAGLLVFQLSSYKTRSGCYWAQMMCLLLRKEYKI